MNLTLKQFESVMDKFNIEAINPMGEKFNPELHQAMAMQPNPEMENNTVMAVMQKGFTMSGRLVRPAMVMVVKN
jgi:molecular chaperone GrpE